MGVLRDFYQIGSVLEYLIIFALYGLLLTVLDIDAGTMSPHEYVVRFGRRRLASDSITL